VVKRTLVALLVLGVMGCDCNARDALRGAMRGQAAELAPVEPPSEDESRAFIESLVAASQGGDVDAVNAHIDWHAIATRATHGLTDSKEMIKDLVESASEAARERGVPAKLASLSKGQISLRHLGAQERDGETWQVVRMTMAEGGFDHLAFLLETKKERTRAVDLWQLTLGETSSALMRRMLLPSLSNDAKSVLGRLTGRERAYVDNIGKLVEAQKLASEGRGHDALHLLDGLPESLQKERFVMLMRVGLAQSASPQEHLREIEALVAEYPDDPTTHVHLIDGYVMQGNPEKALDAVDRVEASSLSDPFLDVIRANVLGTMNRWAEAKTVAERAIEREPTLEDAYWPVLVGSVIEKEYAETTRMLILMREKFGVEVEPERLPIYGEYVQSPEYQEYKSAIAAE
jgi:pentatricopeptide repeat protein